MKSYLLIDAHLFNFRVTLLEQDRAVMFIKEDYCLLEKGDEKIWRRTFPKYFSKTVKQYNGIDVVILLPDAMVLNMILTLAIGNDLSVEQKISRALSKNFDLNLRQWFYKYVALNETCYGVNLILRKNFLFIQSVATSFTTAAVHYFSSWVGAWSYFNQKRIDGRPYVAIFFEENVRRFFVYQLHTFECVDFYVQLYDKNSHIRTLMETQNLMAKVLNLSSENKHVMLIGGLDAELAEFCQSELHYQVITDVSEITGNKSKLPIEVQAIYAGISSILKNSQHDLRALDFSDCSFQGKFFEKLMQVSVLKYKRYLAVFCILNLLLVVILWFYNRHLKAVFHEKERQYSYIQQLKQDIKTFQIRSRSFKKENESGLFIPQSFLEKIHFLQDLKEDICLDALFVEETGKACLGCIKGRIVSKMKFKEVAETFFKKKLEAAAFKNFSLDFRTIDNRYCEFLLKFSLYPPKL